MEIGWHDLVPWDVLLSKKSRVPLCEVFLEDVFGRLSGSCATAHFVKELLHLKHVAVSECSETELDQCSVVKRLSVVILVQDLFGEGRDDEQFFALFSVVDSMIVNEIQKGLDLGLLIFGVLEHKVRIILQLLFIDKLQELRVRANVDLDPFDQGSTHEVSILQDFEGQLSGISFQVVVALDLLADPVHQVNETNEILQTFAVFWLVGVKENQRFLEFSLDEDEISLERKVNGLFGHTGRNSIVLC